MKRSGTKSLAFQSSFGSDDIALQNFIKIAKKEKKNHFDAPDIRDDDRICRNEIS
jgi:hypothetical protein